MLASAFPSDLPYPFIPPILAKYPSFPLSYLESFSLIPLQLLMHSILLEESFMPVSQISLRLFYPFQWLSQITSTWTLLLANAYHDLSLKSTIFLILSALLNISLTLHWVYLFQSSFHSKQPSTLVLSQVHLLHPSREQSSKQLSHR